MGERERNEDREQYRQEERKEQNEERKKWKKKERPFILRKMEREEKIYKKNGETVVVPDCPAVGGSVTR